MPSSAKIESYTVHEERKEIHFETRKDQPRWLLRNKTYKPLAPGVSDYAIGKEWVHHSAQEPLVHEKSYTNVRLRQSGTGVLDTVKGMSSLEVKKATVKTPARLYSAPNQILRDDAAGRRQQAYPTLRSGDSLDALKSASYGMQGTKGISAMQAQLQLGSTAGSAARTACPVTRYYEDVGHARVGQLLRDRQGGLECVRT